MTISLSDEIKNCLIMFGPCTPHMIQEKLDMRGIEVSQLEILNACEFMVRFKEVREATGFGMVKAFKL